jgi:hypothetical protein
MRGCLLLDVGAMWLFVGLVANKDALLAERALGEFAGTQSVASFYSNNSRVLIEAVEQKGWARPTPSFYRFETKTNIEGAVMTTKEGAR